MICQILYILLLFLSYGLDSLVLDSRCSAVVTKAWNTAFRWLFNLRKFDSTRLVFQLFNTMSLKFMMDMRLMCMYNKLWFHSSNSQALSLCCIESDGCFMKSFNRYN